MLRVLVCFAVSSYPLTNFFFIVMANILSGFLSFFYFLFFLLN